MVFELSVTNLDMVNRSLQNKRINKSVTKNTWGYSVSGICSTERKLRQRSDNKAMPQNCL